MKIAEASKIFWTSFVAASSALPDRTSLQQVYRKRNFKPDQFAAKHTQRQSSGEDAEEQAAERKRRGAEQKVKLREVCRARLLLTSNGLAAGNEETLKELTDENLRPRVPTEELPAKALTHVPAKAIRLEEYELTAAVRAGGRGSTPDLAGMRYEHLRVLLDDENAWTQFTELAQDFARAHVPEEVMQGLRLRRMTALRKNNGKA